MTIVRAAYIQFLNMLAAVVNKLNIFSIVSPILDQVILELLCFYTCINCYIFCLRMS